MTLRVIAIGGEPASGKSSLVKRILRFAGTCTLFEWGLLKGQLYDTDGLAVLGQYDDDPEGFDGTDRLSMAVIDDAEDFLQTAADPDIDSGFQTVLFEGDRLYNDRFLSTCRDHPNIELDAYVLRVEKDLLTARHQHRGDTQGETWLQGRQTKYDRYADEEWTTCIDNETPDQLDANAEMLARAAGLVEPLP